MSWLVASLGMFFVGGVACLATTGRTRLARWSGPAVTVIGGVLGLIPIGLLLSGRTLPAIQLPWSMPFGTIALEMDALSAVFSAPILIVSMLAAVYGAEYLRPFEQRKNVAFSWCFFNLLVGSMLLVVVSRNAILFLLAWELMSLSSFFLVMFESEKESVRQAGWTYLVATHIGTAFLLVLFVMLGEHSGGLDFSGFSVAPKLAGIAFLLAVVGFGTKAGFMPMHVWLPEAHPAAPSHISAVMSGVMIKTGIYGILRVTTFLGAPAPWWGWTLVGIGVTSGIFGVLFALAQRDLKRLLAYSSVENVGIIALGLGVGFLGMSYHAPVVMFLGFFGGLFHVINHALFKTLLFLSAGAVIHSCGTRDIEHMGGLLKRMPITAILFLFGSVAICGLPPLNGFVSEFLIYLGALNATAGDAPMPAGGMIAAPIVIGSLALIGGLAVVCFTKVFGIMFLGEPRSSHMEHTHESGLLMRVPMMILALACVVVGLSGPFWMGLLSPAVSLVAGTESLAQPLAATHALWTVTLLVVGGTGLASVLAFVRSRLLASKPVTQECTWDCGYALVSPRMQYTASSFAAPVTRLLGSVLRTHFHVATLTSLFPRAASFDTETPDLFQTILFRPVFSFVSRLLSRMRWIQHGRLNLYILYIIAALLVLLVWKLR